MRNLTISTWARRGRTWLRAALLAGVASALAPVSAAAQEVVEYYATDAVGSTRVVFNAIGEAVARSDYLPFGEAFVATGNLPAQRFTGQERDGEAGLDNFNARAFDSNIGRFTRLDPAGGDPKAPQTWNRYAYVSNNPLGFTDPSGMVERQTNLPSWWTSDHIAGGGAYSTGQYATRIGGAPKDLGSLLAGIGVGYQGGDSDGGDGGEVGLYHLNRTPKVTTTATPSGVIAPIGSDSTVPGTPVDSTNAFFPVTPNLDGTFCFCEAGLTDSSADFLLPISLGQAGLRIAAGMARVTVTSFTDAAGVSAIRASGTIGTAENAAWVTLPGSVQGMGPQAVERALEIGAGRGGYSFTFSTSRSNLIVPHSGPLTGGGLPQFRLATPVPASAATFRVNAH